LTKWTRAYSFADDVHGTVDTAVDESVDDDAEQPAEVSVAERALQFTREITELSEQGEDSDSTNGEEVAVTDSNDVTVVEKEAGTPTQGPTAASSVQPGPDSSAELMSYFRALLSIASADELSPKLLLAISCLEGESKIVGAVISEHKAKSLVQCWLAKALDILSPATDALSLNDVIIKRDTIVIVKVKFARGAAAANVSCSYCVMVIYDK